MTDASAPYQALHLYAYQPRGENSGQFHHRVLNSAALFSESAVLRVTPLALYDPAFPRAALRCDLLIADMVSAPELEAVIRWRRARGQCTLYEISDNFLGLGGWLPDNHLLRSPLVRQQILFYASMCDGLQVSAPGLAEVFGELNSRVGVLENFVPAPARLPDKPPGFVFGWAGTNTHRDDLAEITPVISAFCQRHPEAVFALMGDLKGLAPLFATIPEAQMRCQPFGPYADYLAFTRTWHVGLAPMRATPFNQGRTDVKFVELAASGTVAVLADCPIYQPHAEHACLFASPDELADILERLHARSEERLRLTQRALDWVNTHRSATTLRDQRYQFYRPFLAGHSPPLDLPDPMDSPERLAEALLAYERQDYESTARLALDLLAARPDYEQACWLAATSLYRQKRYAAVLSLVTGVEISPVYSDLLAELGCLAARHARPAAAADYFARVQSPLIKSRLRASEFPEPGERYRQILAHQPFDYFALLGLIHHLRHTQPESAELPALVKRARWFGVKVV